jgi:hypothetical protein
MVGVLIIEAAQIVHDGYNPAPGGAAILFTAQSTTYHLHITNRAEYLTRDEHHVSFRCIEAGSQDAVVAQDPNITSLESVKEVSAGHSWSFPADGGGANAVEV